MLNFAAIAIILVPLYCVLLFINYKKRKTFIEHMIFTTFYVYICLVIKVTLFQIPIDSLLLNSLRMNGGYPFNLIPLKSIVSSYSDGPSQFLKQVGGNILMFVPTGTYIPLLSKKIRSFTKSIILAILISIMIELTQGVISLIIGFGYRSVDVDDIILNTIGATNGYIFFKIMILPFLLKNPWLMNKEQTTSVN